MSSTPSFVATPNIGIAKFQNGSQNTTRDGSSFSIGTTVLALFAAGSAGSRVDRITVTAAGTVAASTACVVAIYIYDKASTGSNFRLYKEILIQAVTPSSTAIGATSSVAIYGGLILKSTEGLACTCTVVNSTGNQFDVIAEGGDF